VCSALAQNSGFAQLTDRTQPKRGLVSIAGTSMSAPVVSGVIALMLQRKPELTPARIREILIKTARKDRYTGETHWSPAYGFGKINALKAISEL
jgi:subtilisin family serine protease